MNNLAEHMTNKLETDIREFARQLYDEQAAFLFKVPEEMTQTPCDFFGFTRLGRAVLLEAKMVNRPSLPLGKEPGLRPHQLRALDQAEKSGCVSALIWRRGDVTVVVPYADIFVVTGRKSLPWVEPHLDWKVALRALVSRGYVPRNAGSIHDYEPMAPSKTRS